MDDAGPRAETVPGDDVLGSWGDAAVAAAVFAVDPVGLGGAVVRAHAGPVRDRWLELLKSLVPAETPIRRIPSHVGDDRLLGGLDLAATLAAGRPVVERGVLIEADGGIVILPMAERLSPGLAARLTGVMDRHEVAVERDGVGLRAPARFGVIAFDEGAGSDERVPEPLADRLAFHLDLAEVPYRVTADAWHGADDIVDARRLLSGVAVPDSIVAALCTAAVAFGISSLRAPMRAVAAARAIAALDGRISVGDDDASLAARLVLAPRATVLPVEPQDEPDEAADPEPPDDQKDQESDENTDPQGPLDDMLLEAVKAAIPAGLLEKLTAGRERTSGATQGAKGAQKQSRLRGRPIGATTGQPGTGKRLHLVETLRAAAPWQPLRAKPKKARIAVRSGDFRIRRFKQASETLTLFVVDASGSTALNRLAEAKGAIELLLAESYARRDRVALIAFRGRDAELLLPPTRALAHAKRALARLPGGGGTPLAAGLDAALALALDARRRGQTPTIVLLTDGSANVTRAGAGGRAQALDEALSAAHALAEAGIAGILIDTAPRPQDRAARIAAAMNARYAPLPHADARGVSEAVRALSA